MPNVVFIHPDLGIGGAERLIVDAAVALKLKGHTVSIITAHHDTGHCFNETKDGTIPVETYGDWIPRNIFGYCYALCAYIRMIYVAFSLLYTREKVPDVIVCDQVSVAIPVLKWKCPKVVFYCHYPDQLLSIQKGWLKALYRAPINYIEEITTKQASRIFVNSKFTSSVFVKTFKSIEVLPEILYPSLHIETFDNALALPLSHVLPVNLGEDPIVFLSLNRYERKKNVALAVNAFNHLQYLLSSEEWDRCHLIIAGGYDELVSENIQYFNELDIMVWSMAIEKRVTMLKSPKEVQKMSLLSNAACLLYTPSNEHFGIVPLEAMYMQTPVIAVNSGGPTETVVDGKTGFLVEPTTEDFAEAMAKFVKDPDLSFEMGIAGRKRVSDDFSFNEFSRKLNSVIEDLLRTN